MLRLPTDPSESQAAAAFDTARRLTIGILAVLTCLLGVVPLIFGTRANPLTLLLLLRQDLPLVIIFCLAMMVRPRAEVDASVDWIRNSRLFLFLAIIVVFIAGWAGHYLVFQGVHLSRDEKMAVFDQQILAQGAALWPIPEDWRSMADALGRRFMLPIGASEYWVSAYLPVHAAARALVSLVMDPEATSPLFVALAAACTWALARHLWPSSKNVAVVGVILLVTSSQVLITAMTAFSMSMHLGLNLLWLLFFLKDRWQTHALAVTVGFFATGIHQPLFHPLFALPFCVLLLIQRRWRLVGFYAGAYGLISAFWVSWPWWIVSHGSSPPILITCDYCGEGIGFVDRFQAVVDTAGLTNLWLTGANLLRFVTWQHPLLIPLALVGAVGCWRTVPLVKVLTASFLLPIIAMAILMPWQGYGWGYRYLHPVLGNAVLLACYGFHRLSTSGLSFRRPLVITTAVAAGILVFHTWSVAQFIRPFAHVSRAIAAIPADVVIVDADPVALGQDVVFNRHDLSNRPKILIASLLKPDDLAKVCSLGTVAFFPGSRMSEIDRLLSRPPAKPSKEIVALQAAATGADCRIVTH